MFKILICEKIDLSCSDIFKAAGFTVDHRPELSAGDLKEIIAVYDGLVVRSLTKVTAEIFFKADKLKVVGRAGAGLDNIDVDAARERGVTVLNTPGQNANAVAELVIGLLLALVRHIPIADKSIRAGRWEKSKLAGTELFGKTIGIIGFGAVGRRVAELTRAFGLNILAHDPLLTDLQISAGGARPATFGEILGDSNFVTLHLPKTLTTTGLINREVIMTHMKPGAILINCARGGLVDETALAEALVSGRLAGAAMDVFATEPPALNHPLLALDNFVTTPHLGASTAEAQVNVAVNIAQQMVSFFKTLI
ncbi:MAG: hydroxyacid dehydrogenase [Candidatus Adiutrix intracellularis]|jgi:D-3-phosphoglycerate dehydrogenase|nr:hydroxyacid dehydrogenase [Candidatus Adiutrix intracellularis]